ncbi:MAG: hypothetical protein EP309_02060 [Gammaproteobacteria bacterium]|nr:MAG: hypothetical protein EP309_02060 [Gammaproteobacteria bacterium]
MAIEVQSLDLTALLAKLERLLAPKARAEGLSLRIPRPMSALGPLQGDPLRLEQVLTNLIGNAIKFTDTGLVVVEVEVLVRSAREVRLRFAVHDTGIGIAPEVLKDLFTPSPKGLAALPALTAAPGSAWPSASAWSNSWAAASGPKASQGRAVPSGSSCRCNAPPRKRWTSRPKRRPPPARASPWRGCASWWWRTAIPTASCCARP